MGLPYVQSQIDCARSHVLGILTDTCTIKRRVGVPDGRGGITWTYSNFATGVPCRFASVSLSSMSEVVVGSKITSVVDGVFTFVYSQDVEETDRIIWESQTFEVARILQGTDQVLLRVQVTKLD